ncbi:hypothetical protein SVA_3559 [Sulfurifustis variabilis]|uniref:SRPBCC family protein n=1 Tax=Sulfurifustis variabilis TaxID=1675686 RepID=A0A1C7AFI6_9GAMM|nr:SRPBCC family protein [Sulfurifustis variabilis]BAU50095.1 hypothetical protein SVA_3559 [Sulfurifustis variabilis]
MIVVSQTVYIEAPVERVFALMADPAGRSRLNPTAAPLVAEIEGGGPLALGSLCHYRLRTAAGIVDYRTRVREFEPPHRIVSVSETAVPFEVKVELAPAATGTLLTQTEIFEPSEAMLRGALADRQSNGIVQLAYRLYLWLDTDAALELRQRQEQLLQQQLEANMRSWLGSIKEHFERKVRTSVSR